MYRKIPRLSLPVFNPRHITHAVLHFIMTPKLWMHVFRLNARRNNIKRQLIQNSNLYLSVHFYAPILKDPFEKYKPYV